MKSPKEIATEALEFNKAAKEMHVTTDGVPFFTKNDARVHAQKLDDKTVHSFTRDEVFEPEVSDEPEIPTKAEELIQFIGAQEDLDLLITIQADEKRKTVLEALTDRIEELKAINS